MQLDMDTSSQKAIRVLILGAAGRDFHNFNVHFRDNTTYEVVAFTATQIPGIDGRVYPAVLAGKLYPGGIKIYAEDDLEKLIQELNVEQCVFAYSDVSHEYVMHMASRCHAAGADFRLMGPGTTQLKSKKPVVSVCAVRTGCGKSQTSRRVVEILTRKGLKVVSIRHPMPYGDLTKMICQRFATIDDLKKENCSIEEMEEYEPHISRGAVIYAGVDYGKILEEAEKEADVILWDGGNNDFSFYKADLSIVVVDPHRAGHVVEYHPGETTARMADVVIVNKVESADFSDIRSVRENIKNINPKCVVVEAASPCTVADPTAILGKKVLLIEDGPTLTHGGMRIGAAWIAAQQFGASVIVDPYPHAVGTIKDTFEKYDHLKYCSILPAMGYGDQQIKDLEATINSIECDTVLVGTPIDLGRICKINKPAIRVGYDLQEIGKLNLDLVFENFPKRT